MKFTKPKTKRKYKRTGKVTKKELALVKAITSETPETPSNDQTKALAKVFNRPVSTMKKAIATARESLAADSQFYVDTHRAIVEQAALIGVSTMNDKALDIARKGAAWAIERISGDGKRIVDKVDNGPQGTRIMIGIKLSNMSNQADGVIDVSGESVEGEVIE